MGIWHERFENVGSVLGLNPGRGYTGGRRSPTLVDALPSGYPFSHLIYDTQGNSGRILPPARRGEMIYRTITNLRVSPFGEVRDALDNFSTHLIQK